MKSPKAKSTTATKKAAKPKQPTVNQKLISLSEAGQANSVAIGEVADKVATIESRIKSIASSNTFNWSRLTPLMATVERGDSIMSVNKYSKQRDADDKRMTQTEMDLEDLTDDCAKFFENTRNVSKYLGEVLYKNDKHLADAIDALNDKFEKELLEVKKENSELKSLVDNYWKRLCHAETSINNLQVDSRTMRAFQESRASVGETTVSKKPSKSSNMRKEDVIKIAGIAFVAIGVVGAFCSLGHLAVDIQAGMTYLGGSVVLALGGAFTLAEANKRNTL